MGKRDNMPQQRKPGAGVAPVRTTSPDRIGFTSRLPRATYDAIAVFAKRSGRSLSEEIEQRLLDSVTASSIVAELFGSAPDTVELLKLLTQSIEKIRRTAKNKGYDELQTRRALHAAFTLLADVYFWHGQEIRTPEGVIGSMDKPPVATADAPPEAMGYQVADFNLFWNDARALEEFAEGSVSDFWSGDGKKSVQIEDRSHSGTPLNQVLLGDNRAELEHGEQGAPISRTPQLDAARKPRRRPSRPALLSYRNRRGRSQSHPIH
jgi:hypothetical protein